MRVPQVCQQLEGKLIASCQAHEGDVFRDPQLIARFAEAALAGGAAGIRANGAADIRAIRRITRAPILGIEKVVLQDGKVLITPSVEAARALVEAGADMIAVDATLRGQHYGALERIRQIKEELAVPVLADIATVEEALTAAGAGADFVLSTMRGYTPETAHVAAFESSFIEQVARVCPVPVLAEGRIHTPQEARDAITAGAFAVVVGTAITRPRDITRAFAQAIEKQSALRQARLSFLGIDLGGTNTKAGIVSSSGKLLLKCSVPTPAMAGRAALLDHLKRVAQDLFERAGEMECPTAGLGVATAGWVDTDTGTIAYATGNLPGWTGAPVAEELHACLRLPVAVENDANALAVAERHFGAGSGLRDFICITLGTGVGGGCYVAGKLNRGAHYFANAFGHLTVVPGGLPCTCGQFGCLEAYCNAAALERYAGGSFGSAEQIIAASRAGDARAAAAIRSLSQYLAQGCSSLIQLLDPEALILSGGVAQNNPLLLKALSEELAAILPAWNERQLRIIGSPLGYYGGVLGAAAVAMERLFCAL